MIHNPFNLAIFNFHWSQVNAPGAGSNQTIGAVANCRSELVSASFTYTADANPANRLIRVVATHGLYPITIGGMDIAITANDVREVIISQGITNSVTFGADVVMIAIPSFPFLLEGDTININVSNIQATDTIGITRFCMKTWAYEQ